MVAVVNMPGLNPGQLKLTGPLLADIYGGKMKSWTDPEHREAQSRREAARCEHCGGPPLGRIRDDVQLHPLSRAGQPDLEERAWRREVGPWPTGVGGKGNEGVAGYVKQIPNSIGYVEYAYVVQNKMTYAQLQNATGASSAPSAETFQALPRAPTGRMHRTSTL